MLRQQAIDLFGVGYRLGSPQELSLNDHMTPALKKQLKALGADDNASFASLPPFVRNSITTDLGYLGDVWPHVHEELRSLKRNGVSSMADCIPGQEQHYQAAVAQLTEKIRGVVNRRQGFVPVRFREMLPLWKPDANVTQERLRIAFMQALADEYAHERPIIVDRLPEEITMAEPYAAGTQIFIIAGADDLHANQDAPSALSDTRFAQGALRVEKSSIAAHGFDLQPQYRLTNDLIVEHREIENGSTLRDADTRSIFFTTEQAIANRLVRERMNVAVTTPAAETAVQTRRFD